MLKLNIELLVETFETLPDSTGQGTVQAHEWSYVELTCTFATSAPDLLCAAACSLADTRKPRRAGRRARVRRG
jgi:hypothetical protein